MDKRHIFIIESDHTMLELLRKVLEQDPELKVVGSETNGCTALVKITQVQPDVIIMDLNTDALRTLRKIRGKHPKLPVIMFSDLTSRDVASTLQTLVVGAADYIHKPVGKTSQEVAKYIGEQLIPKIKRYHKPSVVRHLAAAKSLTKTIGQANSGHRKLR